MREKLEKLAEYVDGMMRANGITTVPGDKLRAAEVLLNIYSRIDEIDTMDRFGAVVENLSEADT